LSLSEELKASVREILYSRNGTDFSDKDLANFSGVSGIRQLRYNRKLGHANKYDTIIFQYKIEKIYNLAKRYNNSVAKKIIEIINYEVTAGDIAERFLTHKDQISMALQYANKLIENHEKGKISYGYSYYSLSIKIDDIAKAVDAG